MRSESQKEFMKIYESLCYSKDRKQTWDDIIITIATSLNIPFENKKENRIWKRKQYEKSVERLGDIEKVQDLFNILVNELERNPDQDFLGEIFMCLEIENKKRGQFFTPHQISKLMAKLNFNDDILLQIDKNGWASVCDPTVGAGSTLIAFANSLKYKGINYQTDVLFAGADIDPVVGLMAYIQLSLLGCSGYIVITDSIANPLVGDVLIPNEMPGQEFWYMPGFFRTEWQHKRTTNLFKALLSTTKGV